jgi:tetratricopeptide (TPR) repeat protein
MGAPFVTQLPWLAVDLAFIGGAVWLARVNAPLGFGLLWFTVALTPTLHFVPMRVAAADRFMYLPLVGGAIAAGALFAKAVEAASRPAARRAVQAVCAMALVALVVLTELRIPVWYDDLTLWRDTLRHNPRAYMGHHALAVALGADGRISEAVHELEAAIADCPRESKFGRVRFCSFYAARLGYTLLHRRDLSGARAAFNDALEFTPSYAPSFAGLGEVALAEGNLPAARHFADIATLLNPGAPVARAAIDGLRAGIGRAERAPASP